MQLDKMRFHIVKEVLKSKQVQIILCTGFSVLLIASSFQPSSVRPGRGGQYVTGASFEPIQLAIGVALLVAAFLIYKGSRSE